MSKAYREVAVRKLESTCESLIVNGAREAFNGDLEATGMLHARLTNALRGGVAVDMWLGKVKVEAFRVFFEAAWSRDHSYVVEAAATRRRLAAMFRYADFPLPSELADVLSVWRGTSGVSIDITRAGYSWTTDRDVACWFAMRYAESKGSPMVLSAQIAKSSISAFNNERSESEVVLMRAPAHILVDGTPVSWKRGWARRSAAIQKHKADLLARRRRW